ncbi:hypothetical protein V7149_25405, partial [Bacillus sp. JJ1503]|uniref:hypothetical protein n=1 Tax=Bacillus sp. JJ1503 TaxID=3122956 RepID=UPI002FFD78BF
VCGYSKQVCTIHVCGRKMKGNLKKIVSNLHERRHALISEKHKLGAIFKEALIFNFKAIFWNNTL